MVHHICMEGAHHPKAHGTASDLGMLVQGHDSIQVGLDQGREPAGHCVFLADNRQTFLRIHSGDTEDSDVLP